MKNLIKLISILSILILSACNTHQFNSIQTTQDTYSNDIQDTLTLSSIDSEGYHFQSNTSDSGAFIPLSEANTFHISKLSIGDNVTMLFNVYGDILKVNDNEIK